MRATLRLLRPANVALAGAGTLAGAALTHGLGPPAPSWWLAIAATMCVTGFGNVLNDLRDERLDRAAHPDRPLPRGYPRSRAWLLALSLAAAGIALAAATTPAALAVASVNVLLLVAYELALKPVGLPGNVAVAALVGSTIAFGSLATGGDLPAAVLLAVLMASLANLARELLKDLEDAGADAAFRYTFPMRHGAAATRWLARAATCAAVVLSGALAALHPTVWAFAGLGAADGVLLVAATLPSAPAAQRLLKAGMAIALLAFLAMRVPACS